MHPRMVSDVEDGQQDQARCSGDGPDDAQPDEGLFPRRLVGHQPAAVTQPSLGEEGQVERDDGDAGARDEEGLELAGANVADVCDGGIRVHPGVVPVVGVDDPVEEHAEEHAEPYQGGEEWEELRIESMPLVFFMFLFFHYCCCCFSCANELLDEV